jgi:hypothetical protein
MSISLIPFAVLFQPPGGELGSLALPAESREAALMGAAQGLSEQGQADAMIFAVLDQEQLGALQKQLAEVEQHIQDNPHRP